MWTLLARREFRAVWIGSTLSQIGDVCFVVGLPWLVLQMTGSSVALGSVLMTVAIPRAVLMIVGGAISDRFSARTILIVVNAFLAASIGLVAFLIGRHALTMWELYVAAFTFGITDAFAYPALKVLLPSLVQREQIQAANSMMQSSMQVVLLGGSSIAGIVIARWGVVAAFAIDAASFLYLIGALLTLRADRTQKISEQGIWGSILEGLRYVVRNGELRFVVALFALVNMCVTGSTQVGIAILANASYHSSTDYGLLVAASALGSLVGVVAAGVWRNEQRRVQAILAACLALGLLLPTLALPMPVWAALLVLVALGSSAGYVNVVVVSWLQVNVRADLLGRVMSVVLLGSIGAAPISLAVSGVLAQNHLQLLFVGAGLVLVAATAVMGAGTVASRRIHPPATSS
jgi:MFS family permease